jgi:hypothetical protein
MCSIPSGVFAKQEKIYQPLQDKVWLYGKVLVSHNTVLQGTVTILAYKDQVYYCTTQISTEAFSQNCFKDAP